MDAATGKPLSGAAHLAQSVADILSTPIGTRVGLRDYGSDLPALVDAPTNPRTRLRLFAATAGALRRWEPRLKLTRVRLAVAGATGAATLELTGQRLDVPTPAAAVALTVPLS